LSSEQTGERDEPGQKAKKETEKEKANGAHYLSRPQAILDHSNPILAVVPEWHIGEVRRPAINRSLRKRKRRANGSPTTHRPKSCES